MSTTVSMPIGEYDIIRYKLNTFEYQMKLKEEEMTDMLEEIVKLRAINAQYKQALEYIANHEALPRGQREYHKNVATEALKWEDV